MRAWRIVAAELLFDKERVDVVAHVDLVEGGAVLSNLLFDEGSQVRIFFEEAFVTQYVERKTENKSVKIVVGYSCCSVFTMCTNSTINYLLLNCLHDNSELWHVIYCRANKIIITFKILNYP